MRLTLIISVTVTTVVTSVLLRLLCCLEFFGFGLAHLLYLLSLCLSLKAGVGLQSFRLSDMIKYFDLPTSFFLILLAWDCHTIWWEFGFGFHTSTQHRIRGPISHRCFHPQSRRDSVSRHSFSVCELRFPDPPPPLRLLTLSKSPGLLHQEHRAWPLSVQKPQPPEALGLLGIDSHSSDLETSLPAPGNFSFLVSQLYVCKTNFYYILSSVFLSLGEESFPSLLGQPY